jgi:hypothetical protein
MYMYVLGAVLVEKVTACHHNPKVYHHLHGSLPGSGECTADLAQQNTVPTYLSRHSYYVRYVNFWR